MIFLGINLIEYSKYLTGQDYIMFSQNQSINSQISISHQFSYTLENITNLIKYICNPMKNINANNEPSSNYQLTKQYPSVTPIQLDFYNNQSSQPQANVSKTKQIFPKKGASVIAQKANLKLVLPEQPIFKPRLQTVNQSKLKKKIMMEPIQMEQPNLKNTVIKIYDLLEEESSQIVIQANVYKKQEVEIKQNQLFNQLGAKIQQQISQQADKNSFLQMSSHKGKILDLQIPKASSHQQQPIQPIQKNKQNIGAKNKEIFLKMKGEYSQLRKGIFFEHQKQNQDYEQEQISSHSKIPIDTGLQINPQNISRDEASTRQMLSQATFSARYSSKRLLPALKSYKDINQQKIHVFELPNLKKQRKIFDQFRNGKFAITSEQITNVYEFIKKPIPCGKVLECKLIRNKECGKMVYLDYDLMTIDGKFLLGIKKMAFKCGSTYYISLMRESYNEFDEYYLGKVVSNFMGSMFNLYCQLPNSREKEIVATICYSSSCFSLDTKTRQIDIYLKNHQCTYQQLEGSQLQKENNLKNLFQIGKNKETKKIRKLSNKQPKWIPQSSVYALNFHGKSRMGSVKNMIIIDADRPNQQMLLQAKQDVNEFAIDISYPFSPLVAIGVLITSFDFKLISQ